MSISPAVLWDMDGVLVDTGDLHFQAWSEALSKYNLPFSRETFDATFGMNNVGMLSRLLGQTPEPALAAEISDYKEWLFREAVKGHARPLPGVRTWLKRLQGAGVRQVVASSASQANIDTLLEELNVHAYFAATVSGDALPGKPAPDIFLKAARLILVPPGRCIVVEDTTVGIESARRAGMQCIAVATTHPADALQDADVVVDRLDALPMDTFERLFAAAKT